MHQEVQNVESSSVSIKGGISQLKLWVTYKNLVGKNVVRSTTKE